MWSRRSSTVTTPSRRPWSSTTGAAGSSTGPVTIDDQNRRSVDWGPHCDVARGTVKVPLTYAPPCVKPFSGDNGGATAPGVTGDTINVVLYQAQPDILIFYQRLPVPPQGLERGSHRFELLGLMAHPIQELAHNAQRLTTTERTRRIELLVGHIRVVLEVARRLDEVDAPRAVTDGQLAVRPARPDDRTFLLALTDELGAFPVPSWRSVAEIGAADRGILEAAIMTPGPDSLVLVAELGDGTPAGGVFASTRTDYFTGERHAHIEVLAVSPAARGRGVAAMLMREAERWASDRGDRVITLNVFDANTRARALYERLGYEAETVHYRKSLDGQAPFLEPSWTPPEGLRIRLDLSADADAIWAIMQPVLQAGETYAWAPDTTRDEALRLWHPPGARTFVAEVDGAILGTYFLKANQPGLGSHVANCGYMVAPAARGRRVGEAMCRHSLEVARGLGFSAMQFNAVVSTNTSAVALWKRCGFAIVGTVPEAFRHPTKGRVAIHVMYRTL